MSRLVCNYDQMCLCVNNYRGEEYGKPEECVCCEECIFNPCNEKIERDPEDSDKVIFKDEDFLIIHNKKQN